MDITTATTTGRGRDDLVSYCKPSLDRCTTLFCGPTEDLAPKDGAASEVQGHSAPHHTCYWR